MRVTSSLFERTVPRADFRQIVRRIDVFEHRPISDVNGNGTRDVGGKQRLRTGVSAQLGQIGKEAVGPEHGIALLAVCRGWKDNRVAGMARKDGSHLHQEIGSQVGEIGRNDEGGFDVRIQSRDATGDRTAHAAPPIRIVDQRHGQARQGRCDQLVVSASHYNKLSWLRAGDRFDDACDERLSLDFDQKLVGAAKPARGTGRKNDRG